MEIDRREVLLPHVHLQWFGTEADGAAAPESTSDGAAAGGDGAAGGGGGSGAPSLGWRAGLKADRRDQEYAKGFDSVTSLYDRAAGLEEKLKTALFRPGEKATKEEREAFAKAMGRPDNYKGYSLTRGEIPEGLPYGEDTEEWFRKSAFAAGLSGPQAQALFSAFNQRLGDQYQAGTKQIQENREKVMTELRKEHGDKLDGVLSRAKAFVRKFGGEEFMKFLDDSGLGDHAPMIRLAVAASSAMRPDVFVPGDGSPPPATAGRKGFEYSWMREAYGKRG
jgi:hypothetical protein